MNFQVYYTLLLVLLVSGIKSEAEPLTSSSLYQDVGHHDFLKSFHHGGHHGGSSESGNSGSGVSNPVSLSPQVQDQNAGASQDQVAHASVGQVGQVGSPIVGPVSPYIGQKSEVPLHFGARAIG